MIKKFELATLVLLALAAFGASNATAESARHLRHDGEARTFRATDPSGQLMAEWYYTGGEGDWVREDGDGQGFLKAQIKDATIVVYVNIGGTFTPVGQGVAHLNVTGSVVLGAGTSYVFTGDHLNVQSHGLVETFAGPWDLRLSVVQRDGEILRLELSPPPF